jgi:hypothetical protein
MDFFPYCLKVLPVLGVCSGRTNKIWVRHIHSFKVKLNETRGLGDKRRLTWECYQFWIDNGGSFHVKQPNGFSSPVQDQFYGYSMTKKALLRSATRFPKAVPPPLPVAKEKQKKESLRRSSSNIHLFSKLTPLRSTSGKKDPPPPRRDIGSKSTTIHQKKKSNDASKFRNFIIL